MPIIKLPGSYTIDDEALKSEAESHRTVMQGLIEQSLRTIEREIRLRALWAQAHGRRLAISRATYEPEGHELVGRHADPARPRVFNIKYDSVLLRPDEAPPTGFTIVEVHE